MSKGGFDVEHLAELARMNLAGEEKGRFERELGKVLEYVNQLQKIDAEGVEETAQVTGLTNVFQENVDEERLAISDQQLGDLKERRAEMLAAAPETQDDLVKIPAIFGED